MADQLFDKYADEQALREQTDNVLKFFGEIKTGIKELSSMGLKIDQSGNMKELTKNTQDLVALRKQLDESNKRLAESQKTITELQERFSESSKKGTQYVKEQAAEITKQTIATKNSADAQKDLISQSVALAEVSRKITQERTRLRKALDDEQIGVQDFAQQMEDLKQVELSVKDRTLEVARALKNITANNDGESGSLKALRGELNLLLQTYDNLSQTDRDGIIGKQTLEKIDQATTKIKALEEQTGRFQRNVGNYSNSLSRGFDKISQEISRLKGVQQNLNIGGDRRGAEAAGRQIEKLDDIMKVSFDSTKSYTQQVKSLERGYIDLAASGNTSKEFLKEFAEFVAEAKKQSEDLSKNLVALKSDTKTFDFLASSVSAAASGFELAASASALFGESNEEIEKSLHKLVAIQGVANGARELAREITEHGTAANKAYNFVLGNTTNIFAKGVATSSRFFSLLKLGIAGIGVGALLLLIKYFDGFTSEAERATKAVDKLSGVSDDSKERLKKYGETIAEMTKGAIGALESEVQSLNEEFGKQPSAVNDAIAAIQLYTGEVDRIKQQRESFNTLGKKSLKESFQDIGTFLGLTPDRLEEAEKGLAKAQELIRQRNELFPLKDRQEKIGFAAESIIAESELIIDAQQRILSAEKSIEGERIDALKVTYAERLKIIQENLKKEVTAARSPEQLKAAFQKAKIEETKAARDKQQSITEVETEYANRRRKAMLDIRTSERNDQQKINQLIFNDEEAPRVERLRALKEYSFSRAQQIEDDAENEKKTGTKTAEEITAIERKKQNLLLALAIETSDKKDEILKNTSKTEIGLAKNLAAFINTDDAQAKLEDFSQKLKEVKARIAQTINELGTELGELAFDIISNNADAEIAALQKQIELIEEKKNKELDAVNQLNISDKDRADKIAQINGKALQAQKEAEQQRRALERERARIDKARSIAQIIQNTAVGITQVFAQGYPYPLAAALAVVIGALGAAQIARVAAQPLPAYEKGTTNAKKGPAITGEKGKELVKERSGRMYWTNDGPSLTMLQGGETIYPHDVSMKMMQEAEASKSRIFNQAIIVKDNNKELLSKQDEQISLLKQVTNKPASHVSIYNDSDWKIYERRATQS